MSFTLRLPSFEHSIFGFRQGTVCLLAQAGLRRRAAPAAFLHGRLRANRAGRVNGRAYGSSAYQGMSFFRPFFRLLLDSWCLLSFAATAGFCFFFFALLLSVATDAAVTCSASTSVRVCVVAAALVAAGEVAPAAPAGSVGAAAELAVGGGVEDAGETA